MGSKNSTRRGWCAMTGRNVSDATRIYYQANQSTRDGALSYLASRNPGCRSAPTPRSPGEACVTTSPFGTKYRCGYTSPPDCRAWFTDKFVAHYQVTTIFKEKMPKQLGLQSLPNGRPEVLVSVPERALLELLSDVGKRQSLEEATHLVEGLRTLRAPVLDKLLGYTTRIKVARLADQLAQRADLPWANIARRHSARLGGGERRLAVSSSGERIDLRRK